MKNSEKQRLIKTLANCENINNSTSYFDEISQIKSRFIQNPKKVQLVDFLIVFGNIDRFLILDSLRQQDRCVCELEAIIDKSQPAVSHHLKLLEKAQLIRGWKKGKFIHYSLVKKTFDEFQDCWKEWHKEITNWFGI